MVIALDGETTDSRLAANIGVEQQGNFVGIRYWRHLGVGDVICALFLDASMSHSGSVVAGQVTVISARNGQWNRRRCTGAIGRTTDNCRAIDVHFTIVRPHMTNKHLARLSAKRMYIARWLPFLVVGVIVGSQWIAEIQKPTPDYTSMVVVTAIVSVVVAWVQARGPLQHADEVLDGGDFLLVRRGKKEARIELSNVADVSASCTAGATTIILNLTVPSRFGSTISFLADQRGVRWKASPIAAELIARIERRVGRAV
jgi:hypothetical protein